MLGTSQARALGRATADAQWWTEQRAWDLGRWRSRLRSELPGRRRRLARALTEGLGQTGAADHLRQQAKGITPRQAAPAPPDPEGIGLKRPGPAGSPERLAPRGPTLPPDLAGAARVNTAGLVPPSVSAVWAALRGQALPVSLWAAILASRLFDLAGGPELAELVLHVVTDSTPLTTGERTAGAEILGAHAVCWNEVSVAQGGLLDLIFRHNSGRAFAAWHTICLPATGRRVRENLGLIVHELVHVYQYELLGTAYMIEALVAQRSSEGYDYGAVHGLRQGQADGKRYSSYNREQQAQIAQDYYLLSRQATPDKTEQIAESCACYEPYIDQMRAGEL